VYLKSIDINTVFVESQDCLFKGILNPLRFSFEIFPYEKLLVGLNSLFHFISSYTSSFIDGVYFISRSFTFHDDEE